MTRPTRRRFTVTDGMVLVAATAVGLASARALARLAESTFGPNGLWTNAVDSAYSVAFCLSLAWSFALPLLRLRQPRPRLRDLFRQPGFAACVAVMLTATLHVIRVLSDAAYSRLVMEDPMTFRSYLSISVVDECIYHLDQVGMVFAPAVMSVWLVLALGGVWESESSWLDHCGRILGVFWVISAAGLGLFYWLVSAAGD